MISAATVRMTTCRKVKPNKIESLRSTSAGTRARIGASRSRRPISDHPFLWDGAVVTTHRARTAERVGTARDEPPARTGTVGTEVGTARGRGGPLPDRAGTAGRSGGDERGRWGRS